MGADNGVGVCCALALLSQPATRKLPPLEALFTVDEETGLTGAFGLDASMLSGACYQGLHRSHLQSAGTERAEPQP